MTQQNDVHDLVQASGEHVLTLGEALCVFYSRSLVVLSHIRAAEAYEHLQGAECLGKLPKDQQKASVAVGQQHLKLLPSQAVYLCPGGTVS